MISDEDNIEPCSKRFRIDFTKVLSNKVVRPRNPLSTESCGEETAQSAPKQSASFSIGTKVLVNKVLPFAKKGQTRQYKIKKDMKEHIHEMCANEMMSDEDKLEFLDYVKRDIEDGAKFKKQLALDICLEEKSLQDRNELTRLLTHKSNGELNESMLEIFPSLRERSIILLNSTGRKQREDKIDLQFIVDFMHDFCR